MCSRIPPESPFLGRIRTNESVCVRGRSRRIHSTLWRASQDSSMMPRPVPPPSLYRPSERERLRPVAKRLSKTVARSDGAVILHRLDISTGELLEVIATCAIPQLASMPLRDLANIAWAFAVQRHLHHELLAGIAREVTAKQHLPTTQHNTT